MNLLLISGHGAGDPGVTAAINGRAYREADEARKVTAALREALEGSCGVTVHVPESHMYCIAQQFTQKNRNRICIFHPLTYRSPGTAMVPGLLFFRMQRCNMA